MGLLELVSTYGLTPKRKGATRGGEFSSPCPSCGGTDRFILHPKAYDGKGAYFCRQCGIKGDGIQFGRDFLNYSFNQAKKQLGLGDAFYFESSNCSSVAAMSQIKLQVTDQQKWTKKAGAFVEYASQRLCSSQEGLTELKRRGFQDHTINYWCLGFNAIERFDDRDQWGLVHELNVNGNPKKVWLPKGIVIPFKENEVVQKIRIRRLGSLPEQERKYVVVSGSSNCFSWYGNQLLDLPIVLVESDLDAMLLWQEAGNSCLPVALGSSSARPNQEDHFRLRKASKILYSLDWDEAGKKAYEYWRSFPNLTPWPAANGKSIGDDFIAGVNLLAWVSQGIQIYT